MPGGCRRRALGERLRRPSRSAAGERHHRAGGRDPPRHRNHPRQSRHHGLSQAAGAQRAAGPLSGRRGRLLYEPRPAAGAAPAACASCGNAAVKIAILSRKSDLYSTRRLVEAGNQRGHDMRVIDPLRCYMNIATDRPLIHNHGDALTGFDAVIPRIGASVTFYGTAVLRQFEMLGVFPLNESVAITRARDKLHSLQLLSRKGIGLPITGFVHSPDDTGDALRMVGGAPVVIKLLEGTQGIGVVLAETARAARAIGRNVAGVDILRSHRGPLVMEVNSSPGLEGIETASGKDVTTLIIEFIEENARPHIPKTRGIG